ncbi:MAG TPA: YdeI/OmpD-associated family protein [Burkholderiales bacterium]
MPRPDSLPIRRFASEHDWAAWLERGHARSRGLWLQIARKGANVPSVSYAEALEVALCYGWIDGQKRSQSDTFWLQKFGPRTKTGLWSRINREKALALVAAGRMRPPGMAEIQRAKADGRWKGAYDSARAAKVPEDLERALERSAKARRFFAALDRANRYAILYRLQTAKKAETRARRLADFLKMLERGRKIHN